MKVVVASDSFKGSCSTIDVGNFIEKGFTKIYPNAEMIKIPIADGGEGTVDALIHAKKGKYQEVEVIGPLGSKIISTYGILDNETAIIEMSSASGITLIDKGKLNPMITTTYGTGELIKDAVERGIKKIYLGLGGSSTNDGGVGMAQALGISFKDQYGDEVGYGGGELIKIVDIDYSNIHPSIKNTKFIAMSDVENPLCGLTGASYIFGPQKGADKNMVKVLDMNLRHLGNLINKTREDNVFEIPGGGAAGGLGAGMIAFCNATMESGIETVLDLVDIESYLADVSLLITGEGKIDEQSKYGKVPVGVAKRAAKYGIPVIAIVGSVGSGASDVYDYGIDLITDIISTPMSLEEAVNNAGVLIQDAAENVGRILKLVKKIGKNEL